MNYSYRQSCFWFHRTFSCSLTRQRVTRGNQFAIKCINISLFSKTDIISQHLAFQLRYIKLPKNIEITCAAKLRKISFFRHKACRYASPTYAKVFLLVEAEKKTENMPKSTTCEQSTCWSEGRCGWLLHALRSRKRKIPQTFFHYVTFSSLFLVKHMLKKKIRKKTERYFTESGGNLLLNLWYYCFLLFYVSFFPQTSSYEYCLEVFFVLKTLSKNKFCFLRFHQDIG